MEPEIDVDHNCPICMRLLYDPVQLECKHTFCSLCLKHLLRSNPKKACPMCRADLETFDQENTQPDESLQQKVHTILLTNLSVVKEIIPRGLGRETQRVFRRFGQRKS